MSFSGITINMVECFLAESYTAGVADIKQMNLNIFDFEHPLAEGVGEILSDRMFTTIFQYYDIEFCLIHDGGSFSHLHLQKNWISRATLGLILMVGMMMRRSYLLMRLIWWNSYLSPSSGVLAQGESIEIQFAFREFR